MLRILLTPRAQDVEVMGTSERWGTYGGKKRLKGRTPKVFPSEPVICPKYTKGLLFGKFESKKHWLWG